MEFYAKKKNDNSQAASCNRLRYSHLYIAMPKMWPLHLYPNASQKTRYWLHKISIIRTRDSMGTKGEF